MRDMLPRKSQLKNIDDIKKGLKDSSLFNGMNPPTPVSPPGHRSPHQIPLTESPSNDATEGLLFKSESPALVNSSDGSTSPAVTMTPTSSSSVTSPLPSPSVVMPNSRSQSKQNPTKLRRNNVNAEQKQNKTNQMFDFGQSSSEQSSYNNCANNNNNSKHRLRDKSNEENLRQICGKITEEQISRTPSDLSPNSIKTEEQCTTVTSGDGTQNLDEFLGSSILDDKVMEALNDITDPVDTEPSRDMSEFVGNYPGGGDLELVGVTAASNYPSDFATTQGRFDVFNPRTEHDGRIMIDGSMFPDNMSLRGARDQQSPVTMTTVSPTSTITTATCAVTLAANGISQSPTVSSCLSSPTFHPESTTIPHNITSSASYQDKYTPQDGATVASQSGKSHLQEILGYTDTISLRKMSQPVVSTRYKSPTTTSYSTNIMKPPLHHQQHTPSAQQQQQHKLQSTNPFSKPHRPFSFETQFYPNARNMLPFMEQPPQMWNRNSPNMMRSPPYPQSYADPSNSPSDSALINPMSGLQSTVDSIPAVPSSTITSGNNILSDPNTPVGGSMGPPSMSPADFDGTTPPAGRMRPPASPSIPGNDKRCVSADSVNTTPATKTKSGNKRERTRSADSRDEDKKDPSAPKPKRRKSRSKEDSGKKNSDAKCATRTIKGEPRVGSTLSGLLDVQSTDPYLYIFNTKVANEAANTVTSDKVPSIILYHQSFLGNCKLYPSEDQTSLPFPSFNEKLTSSVPSVSSPQTSVTTIQLEKTDNTVLKTSPSGANIKNEPMYGENTSTINLREMKPASMPTSADMFLSQSMPAVNDPSIMQNQTISEELTAEKLKHREDALSKIQHMKKYLIEQKDIASNNVWQQSQQMPNNMSMAHQYDRIRPGMKEGDMDVMGQMSQEHMKWYNLVEQEYNVDKRRNQPRMPGVEIPSRPPPPYNGPHPRWNSNEPPYNIGSRIPMDTMNHRFPRMAAPPTHRPLTRMPQETMMPRVPGGFYNHRRPVYGNPNPRMAMYDPYMGQPNMMGPGVNRPPILSPRLPPGHPAIRQPGSENYPFSEQLMKQAASYYSRESGYGGFDGTDPNMMTTDWTGNGQDGTQRLSHMPGGSSSPVLVGQNAPTDMMNPSLGLDMNPEARLTPVEMQTRMPNPRMYEMRQYPPEQQRFENKHIPGGYSDPSVMGHPLGSPNAPMDVRMRGGQIPLGAPGGQIIDIASRRGEQRPPDLNLNSHMSRSPLNFQSVRGPLPSPNISSIGHRYSADHLHHHASPMHGTRSPHIQSPNMTPYNMPPGGVIEQPQVMIGGGPHSAGPMSSVSVDWGAQGPRTPINSMMHHNMMTSQPVMMTSQQQQQQQSMNIRMQSSGKIGPDPLTAMISGMSSFKMPEQSPLYQEAVKDTTSPPPLNHNEPPPLSHNTMPGGIRMNGPNHPPNYDTRMGIPRMPGHPHMIENYPGGHPSPQIQNNNPMMMIGPESMQRIRYRHPTRCGQSGFPAEFDLTDILPSEKPSQTLSYYPPINPPENEPMQSPLASMGQSMQPHPSPQQAPGNRFPMNMVPRPMTPGANHYNRQGSVKSPSRYTLDPGMSNLQDLDGYNSATWGTDVGIRPQLMPGPNIYQGNNNRHCM